MKYKTPSVNLKISAKTIVARIGIVFWASVIFACSTYSRDIVQRPLAGEGVQIREARDPLTGFETTQAVYTTPAFQLTAWVPLSGSRRVAFGPCLLPIVPGTKEFPRSLDVVLMIAPAVAGAAGQSPVRMTAKDWHAVLGKGDDLGALEVDTEVRPYRIVSRPATDLDPLSGSDVVLAADARSAVAPIALNEARRFRITFAEFDTRFDGFVLRGLRVQAAGREHVIPEIRFESTSRGRYTPFTTKILDL